MVALEKEWRARQSNSADTLFSHSVNVPKEASANPNWANNATPLPFRTHHLNMTTKSLPVGMVSVSFGFGLHLSKRVRLYEYHSNTLRYCTLVESLLGIFPRRNPPVESSNESWYVEPMFLVGQILSIRINSSLYCL